MAQVLEAVPAPSPSLLLELLQRALQTAYRAQGAKGIVHEADGTRVHGWLFDGDTSRTLVLLHGLGDASTTWYKVIARLRGEHRILAVDIPPFGLSRTRDGAYLTPDGQARAVLPLVRRHVQGDVTLVGTSMGGWAAQWILHTAPDLADTAVLVSPAGAALEGSLVARELLQPETSQDVLDIWDRMWHRRPVAAELLARSSLQRFQGAGYQGVLRSATEEHVLTDAMLAGIETPALVIWGTEDRLLDPGTPAWLAERWGGPLERTYLARCGHLPHLERAEAVVGRLESFVERYGGS